LRSSRAHGVRAYLCAAVESSLLIGLLTLTAHYLGSARGPAHLTLMPRVVLVTLVIQLCLYYNDLYEDFAWRRRRELLVRIGKSYAVALGIIAALYLLLPVLQLPRRVTVAFVALAFVVQVFWRFVFVWGAGHEALARRLLIIGTGSSAQQVANEVRRRNLLGFHVAGFLGEHQAEVGRSLGGSPVVGLVEDLEACVEAYGVEEIVVAVDERGTVPMAGLLNCRMAGLEVEEAATFQERITGNIPLYNLRPSWLVFSRGFDVSPLVQHTKRAGDILASATLLALLAPLMGVVALLVKLTSAGSILYRQERIGYRGRVFWLTKFRSMQVNAEAEGPVWADSKRDPRTTPIGHQLRRFRLDELPQLLNILRGEMSFVGPRPERSHFSETLSEVLPFYKERERVRPGVTGWAQIKFGYASTIEDSERKLQYDLYYIKNMSLFLDVGILFDTFKVMLPRRKER